MKVSKKIIDLTEKLKKYRENLQQIKKLEVKNKALTKQNKELKESIKTFSSKIAESTRRLRQIKELEEQVRKLKLDIEGYKEKFEFLVTMPNKASSVYGEIRTHLKNAKKQVLICSPWITYLVEEISGLGKEKDVRVITRLIKEDVKKGITDLNKFRALKDIGAKIRYNNNLHAKMVIIDSSIAIISSANLTKRGLKGLDVNYEAGILLKDPGEVSKVINFFDRIWNESKELTEDEIKKIMK